MCNVIIRDNNVMMSQMTDTSCDDVLYIRINPELIHDPCMFIIFSRHKQSSSDIDSWEEYLFCSLLIIIWLRLSIELNISVWVSLVLCALVCGVRWGELWPELSCVPVSVAHGAILVMSILLPPTNQRSKNWPPTNKRPGSRTSDAEYLDA